MEGEGDTRPRGNRIVLRRVRRGKEADPNRKARLRNVSLWALRAGAVAALLVALVFLSMVLFMPLPENKTPQSTQILDSKGRQVSSVFVEDRIVVPSSDMPQDLRMAVVAVEDMRFYRHIGFDPESFMRALIRDIKARAFVEGGSTITQQLAKNLFLTQEKTLTRKFVELAYTFKLEMRYTKDEILTMYINQIYWGHGTWGCEVASRTYFDKPVRELNLAECALLAGIIRSPEYYSPYANMDRAISRRNLVLDLMVQQGYATAEEAEEAKKETVELPGLPESVAPYFVSYVIQQVKERHPNIADQIARGGYKIYTTLDLDMQKAAEAAFAEYVPAGAKDAEGITQPQGALIAVEPATGYVKAMVGGRNWAESQLNRTYQVKRQPGSAFKIFLYTAVFDAGHPVTETKVCEPVSFVGATAGSQYRPVDYGSKPYHYYPINIRQAITISDNVVATKWAQEVGPSTVAHYAEAMGVRSELQANIPLALGASEVVPLDMAIAAATLSAGGIRPDPLSILRIEDARGLVIEENTVKRTPVLDAGTAYLVTSCLRSVLGPEGTGEGLGAFLGGHAAAGKTGTTDNQLEGWFVGYTVDLATAVYVGYDHREKSLPATGGAVAGPIWAAFMGEALKDTPNKEWDVPSSIRWAEVCDDTNLLAGRFCPNRHYELFIRGTEPPVDNRLPWQHDWGGQSELLGWILPGSEEETASTENTVGTEVPVIVPREVFVPGLIPPASSSPTWPLDTSEIPENPDSTVPPSTGSPADPLGPLPNFEDLWRRLFPE